LIPVGIIEIKCLATLWPWGLIQMSTRDISWEVRAAIA